jgi:serine/threonine protein kinase
MINIIYFSLDRIPTRPECEKLGEESSTNIYNKSYSSVYECCKDKNCNYILKVIKFNKELSEFNDNPQFTYEYRYKKWFSEIKNYLKIMNCKYDFNIKFAPILYDSWFYNEDNEDNDYTSFYIIMEKFDGNLKDFIDKYKNDKLLKNFLSTTLRLLETSLLHINEKCNICIDDIKLENILYKINSKGLYEFVFSDFGTTVLSENVDGQIFEDCVKKDKRKFEYTVEEFLSNF